MLTLTLWKDKCPSMYNLYTKQFDIFNEHAGEVVFSSVSSDISRRLHDKASFHRRNNLYLLAPHLHYLAKDFKEQSSSQQEARYTNSHDTAAGKQLKEKAVAGILKLLNRFCNNTYKPFDSSSFNEYSVKFASLTTCTTQFKRIKSDYFKDIVIAKAKHMFNLLNKESDSIKYSQELDVCDAAFNINDYNMFDNFTSNYSVDQENHLQTNVNNLEE